ncbi:maleylpyruvate isomerase family mycothiol-dependent enzyme [Arthrobacter zhaoguopingii]|uniref:maleylpyruvate isomerase family mycothiol-dependent enzyme n=1 Tax=Arthrobacter zhaoguopingii TaxID=2681491 RepID=UPI00191646E0|nr:maleylpyruvate isomerase family mycothiol-dependent enzyme [Arthrobacter zhaoguopingii]
MTEDRPPMRAAEIARIGHQEAMRLAAEENQRFSTLLQQLSAGDWGRGTDCARWTVRDVAVHVVASAEAQASPLEFLRQAVRGRRLTAQIGGQHWVDGLNEAQLQARRDLGAPDIPARWASAAGAALRSRRRLPGAIGRLRLLPLGSMAGVDFGWQPLSYLFDIGFTRDVWMHRIDIARATDRPLNPTREHDGRIVEDIIAEWATLHADPFHLRLTGPAGGTFVRDDDGSPPLKIDAIDCCRILSGRGTPAGVLEHPLPL